LINPQDQQPAAIANSGIGIILDRFLAGKRFFAVFRRQIGTGTKGPFARPSHHHRPHIIIRIDAVKGVGHFLDHRPGKGVHLFRPIDRDRRNIVGDIVKDLGVIGHAVLLGIQKGPRVSRSP